MTTRIIIVMTLLIMAGCVADSQSAPCEEGDPAGSVTGDITEGKEVLPGIEPRLPHKVVVLIRSDVLIQEVRVGDVPARLIDAAGQRWEAQLFQADLEAHRQADSVSRLDVVATDLCDTSHPIDQVAVALGPAPGVSVSELAITEEHAPDWECSVPIAGGVTPLIRVTASPASVGASVTVRASSGSFAGGSGEQTLTLIDAGDRAQATTFFLPGAAGTAVITAAGKGATATPLAVRVVDRPSITAPATALQRGLGYGVTVSTAGNLETCLVEEVVPGAAIVTAIEPALGIISGQTSVRADPVSCDSEERLRLTVQFVDDAPDEAAVTLRCFDTYGQAAQATFAVAPAAPEILIDGDLQ
jgi:hypothetical protein